MKSHAQGSQEVTTGDTTIDVIQGETGKASLGSISNIEGSPSSHTEPTANVHPLIITTVLHSLPHIESPYVLLTISPSGNRGLSQHGDSAAATKMTDQATGTLTVPPHNTLTATPHIGINALGQIFTPINAHTVVFQDASLSIGGEALTMHNVEVSMGIAGLVVGTTTIAMPSAGIDPARHPQEQTDANHASTVTAGGRTWTFSGGNQVMVDGVTISKGSHPVMLDGTLFSFGSTALVAGTAIIPMPVAAAATSHGFLSTAVGPTIEEQLGHGEVLWSGVTITEGASAITILGSPVSYGSSGLIIGTSSIAIPSKTADPSEVIPLSAADGTFTSVSKSLLVVDGTTLFMGSTARVVDGKTMSYGSSGLVVDTSTVPIPNSDSTVSNPLGNIIMSGFGLGPAASATSVEAFKGAAVDISRQKLWLVYALSMGIGLGVWVLYC